VTRTRERGDEEEDDQGNPNERWSSRHEHVAHRESTQREYRRVTHPVSPVRSERKLA
jgi:hypothetical protein